MRKIAIITDGWRTDTNYAWIGGCRQFIQEHGLDADLYSTVLEISARMKSLILANTI